MKTTAVVLGVLLVTLYTGHVFAFSVVLDGVLDEWVGDEINNLGQVPAPGGGTYNLAAVWDGTTLVLGVDRNTS